jgi:predicted HTH domain antitoxin
MTKLDDSFCCFFQATTILKTSFQIGILHGILLHKFIIKELTMSHAIASDAIILTVPRDLINITKLTAKELQSELIIALYTRHKISFSKARQLTGLTTWEFRQLLGQRNISPHYDIPDYEQEMMTLQELGQL